MSATTDMVWFLNQQTAITAYVDDRIEHAPLGQGQDIPAITYQLISTPRGYAQNERSGVAQPRIQLDVWSDDDVEAGAIAALIVVALDKWRAQFGGGATVEGPRDGYEADTGLYRQMLDVTLDYTE